MIKPTSPHAAPAAQLRLGQFELVEHIGSGGMADVFRARIAGISGFEKTVVVKRLKQELAGLPAYVQMFVDEAKLAAQIHHQNVVQVFELGCVGREYFMAMEYIDGVDLKRLLYAARKLEKPLPVWFVVHLILEVLEGLAFAHALRDPQGRPRNVVHRDVTPENVFVSRYGDVKLGDFGVASDDSRPGPEPFPGQIKGKVPYLSPEQVANQKPDARSDLFAVGIVLWESLTGRRLFAAATAAETMAQICSRPRVPPSRFNAKVPPQLDRLVLDALAIERSERIGSAAQMQATLSAISSQLHPPRVSLAEVRAVVDELVNVPVDAPLPEPSGDLPGYATADLADGYDDDLGYADELDFDEAALPNLGGIDASALEQLAGPAGGADADAHGYAIHARSPRCSSELPVPEHEGHATDDLLRNYLAYETPIQAKPSASDTDDILRGGQRRSAPAYEDCLPFWLRDGKGPPMGPMSASDLMAQLRGLRRAGDVDRAQISGDSVRWTGLRRFGELLGSEVTPAEVSLPQSQFSGSLRGHSLASVLGHLARSRSTGRLVLVRRAESGPERAEIHISRGRLTHTTNSASAFALWEMYLGSHLFQAQGLQVSLHSAVVDDVPLADLVSDAVLSGLHQTRAIEARRQLELLFGWDNGFFGFDTSARPLAGEGEAILPLLPRLVFTGVPQATLREALGRSMHVPQTRTDRFDAEVDRMRLRGHEHSLTSPFGRDFTVCESLAQQANGDQHFGLALAYLLQELNLIRATATAPWTQARSANHR